MKKSDQELSAADKNRIQSKRPKGTPGEFSDILAAMEVADARNAGLTVAEWMNLSECERVRLLGNHRRFKICW